MGGAGTVDTGKTTDYRTLRFETLGEIQRELDTLAAAHRDGTLRTSGNWTPGQNFSHLAAFITYGFDGYPPEISTPPWFIKAILKFLKKRFLYKQLPRGVNIPGVKGGTVGADDVSFEDGMARLRGCLDRLERSCPASPNPIFGQLTHAEWKSLHMRHSELHLGFLHPR